jgi:ferredoxin
MTEPAPAPLPVPVLFTAVFEPEGVQVDAFSNECLLLSAEMGGLSPLSSCRNGTCRTCLCRLRSGQVHYQVEWPGLSEEEKAAGYILPCVACPLSDVVIDTSDTSGV